MIDSALYFAFVAASFVVVAIPGPNVALIVATSLRHGVHRGLLTVLGTSIGLSIQLTLIVAGFALLLALTATVFSWLRWAGVAYLIWLGWTMWRSPLAPGAAPMEGRHRTVARGAFVALANPKTLLFHSAFMPQFVDVGGSVAVQLSALALTFVVMAAILDSSWAILAARFKVMWANNEVQRRIPLHKLSGGLMIGAGVGLAATRE